MSFLSNLFSSKTTSSSTTTPQVDPALAGLQSQVGSTLQGYIANPESQIAPLRAAGQNQIDDAYAGAPQSVATQLARRGFGSSGAAGDAQYNLAIARNSDFANLEGTLATDSLQQQTNNLSLASQFLRQNTGSNTNGTSTTTQNPLGQLLTDGLSAATTLFGLNKLLSSQGAGPGSNPFGSPADGDTSPFGGNGAGTGAGQDGGGEGEESGY